jgi:hypothetical protein
MVDKLNEAEREILLKIAREALDKSVRGEPLPQIDLPALPPHCKKTGPPS